MTSDPETVEPGDVAFVPQDIAAARVAAAYEAIARRFDEAEAEDIRAMTDADAIAALERIKAEARIEGMRAEARLVSPIAEAILAAAGEAGFISGVFGVGMIIYFVVCALAVPAHLIERWKAGHDCAQQHNVFRCERIEIWKPVPAEKEADHG